VPGRATIAHCLINGNRYPSKQPAERN